MMGTMVDYWYYTGDDSYVNLTIEALLFQVGDSNDYMPRNQTLTEGNDDQGFWGLSVMSAAENNFPDPPANKPQWLALAQAVFNTQAARWEMEHCNGGLRWQIFEWNNGYDYKNSISQACFFALGARLAIYTGNNTYAEWAEKTWDWMIGVGFIDKFWRVRDGAHIGTNCTDIIPYLFTYNAGGFILGAAAMYNYTKDEKWRDRLDNLWMGSRVFFTGPKKNIMTEVACEPVSRCNLDQQSFKAYFSRWLAAITKWAPHMYDAVMPFLRTSAIAAAKQCVGGDNGRMCGLKWNLDRYDGSTGVGQQMAALEVTLACMISERPGPVTQTTGGTSKGDPGGGGDDIGRSTPRGPTYTPITAGDRTGAAILTMLMITGIVSGIVWVFVDETSDEGVSQQAQAFYRSVAATIAANGGIMAMLQAFGRKLLGDDEDLDEKRGGGLTVWQTRSVRIGSDTDQAVDETPVRIGQVRKHQDKGYQDRMSNMPRGWPHNPSLRASAFDLVQGRPRSTREGDGRK